MVESRCTGKKNFILMQDKFNPQDTSSSMDGKWEGGPNGEGLQGWLKNLECAIHRTFAKCLTHHGRCAPMHAPDKSKHFSRNNHFEQKGLGLSRMVAMVEPALNTEATYKADPTAPSYHSGSVIGGATQLQVT